MRDVSILDIRNILQSIGGWGSVYIPEYTWGDKRIDAAIVDVRTRWIRGFEIKISRADWLADEKWMQYSEFLSSLSVVCPEGLIQKIEVPKPFGLLWISESKWGGFRHDWIKRPKRFQTRDGMAWLFTYMRVIEKELPRLDQEVASLKSRLNIQLLDENKKEGV